LNLQAVRQGPWKLHLEKGELYHLDPDIGETRNVAENHPEIVTQLRRLAEEMQDDLGTTGIGPGCRQLGQVANARPLIDHDGTIREPFSRRLPEAGMGIMVGEVTDTSALVQVRLAETDVLVEGDVPGMPGVVQY